ncbi:MAG: hypothetical protein J0L92_01930 [Deltaproteobacteria bacterium]|nr:hypothetical protein [Deltaproteobacteria bacterium]
MTTTSHRTQPPTRPEHGTPRLPVIFGLAAVVTALASIGCAPMSAREPAASAEAALVAGPDSELRPTRMGVVLAGQTVTGSFSPRSMHLSWTFETRSPREHVVVHAHDGVGVAQRPMDLVVTVYRATAGGLPTGAPVASARSVPDRELPGQVVSTPRLELGLAQVGRYVVVLRALDYATSGSVQLTVSLPTRGLACGTPDSAVCDESTYCVRSACGAAGVCEPLPADRGGTYATVPESAYACGCDAGTYPSTFEAMRNGGGVAYTGTCRPLVGPVTAARDSAAQPTQVGTLLPSLPQRASFSSTSRFLAWRFENRAARAPVVFDVRYEAVYHELAPALTVSLYRATPEGLPTGAAWVAWEPGGDETNHLYRIAVSLPAAGSYVLVVRGAQLRTRGTVTASLTVSTLGYACGTADTVTCDGDTYCARPAGTCGAVGVCERPPSSCRTAAGFAAAPVCGCDGATYPSACDAIRSDAAVAFEGDCRQNCRVLGCGAGEVCTYRATRQIFECALVDPSGPVCDDSRVDPSCRRYPPPAAPTGV